MKPLTTEKNPPARAEVYSSAHWATLAQEWVAAMVAEHVEA